MTKEPLISIIVPVYNNEKYLCRCIDSIIAQTFIDWECLLIDDGSTDSSPKICDEYAQRDNRIKVIHQENKGVSAARNTGIEKAIGKWISFCDSDDWLANEAFNYYAHLTQKENVDYLICSYYVDDKPYIFNQQLLYSAQIFLEKYSCDKLWNGVYKGEIIRRNDLRFNNDIIIGEDRVFNLSYLQYCKAIYISGCLFYHYFFDGNNTSLSHNGQNLEKQLYKASLIYKYQNNIFRRKNDIIKKELNNSLKGIIWCATITNKSPKEFLNYYNYIHHEYKKNVLSFEFNNILFYFCYIIYLQMKYCITPKRLL